VSASGIVDAHVHVGSPDLAAHPRSPHYPRAPRISATIEDFEQLGPRFGVGQAVLVQPSEYGFDNSYLCESLHRGAGQFVGIALADPDDRSALDDVAELARAGLITGVRFGANFDDGRDWLGPPGRRLLESARSLRLVVSFFVRPAQFEQVERILEDNPDLICVVDHLGRPDLADGDPSSAVRDLVRLARFPGVHVKVSALPALSRQPFPHRDTWGWARQVEQGFGVHRLMWGSDYPLSASPDSYGQALEVVALALPDLSEGESKRLLGTTARSVYRLSGDEGHAATH
jgi:predicted TIM-barrel fold metal-dependent hydrolase